MKQASPIHPTLALLVNAEPKALRAVRHLGGILQPVQHGRRMYAHVTFPTETTFDAHPFCSAQTRGLAYYGVHAPRLAPGMFLELIFHTAPLYPDSPSWLLVLFHHDIRQQEVLARRWKEENARTRERGTSLCQLGFCLQALSLFCEMCNQPACVSHLRGSLCIDCYDHWLDQQKDDGKALFT